MLWCGVSNGCKPQGDILHVKCLWIVKTRHEVSKRGPIHIAPTLTTYNWKRCGPAFLVACTKCSLGIQPGSKDAAVVAQRQRPKLKRNYLLCLIWCVRQKVEQLRTCFAYNEEWNKQF